jgi:hypothetical protein
VQTDRFKHDLPRNTIEGVAEVDLGYTPIGWHAIKKSAYGVNCGLAAAAYTNPHLER